jgi:hypothetical protein
MRNGQWRLLKCIPAWDGNWTWDCFLVFAWEDPEGERMLVTVNYAPNQSQCYVELPFGDLAGSKWRLQDEMAEVVYERDGNTCNLADYISTRRRGTFLPSRSRRMKSD